MTDIVIVLTFQNSCVFVYFKLSGGQDFRWKNCRQDDPVQLKSLTLTPDPLQPGNPAQFSVALKVGEQLDSLQVCIFPHISIEFNFIFQYDNLMLYCNFGNRVNSTFIRKQWKS